MNTSISLSNTLLADGSVVSSSAKRTGTHFLDRYNLDPNRLWKRKQYHISNIGHVDPLGRLDFFIYFELNMIVIIYKLLSSGIFLNIIGKILS